MLKTLINYSKKNQNIFMKNHADNVFILSNNNLENFFKNGPINALYNDMLKKNINFFTEKIMYNIKTNFELNMDIVSKYRKVFRQYLFNQKEKNVLLKIVVFFLRKVLLHHILNQLKKF